MPVHDVLIVGAGPVGLALALALKDADLDIALVDARDAAATASDPRVLALAHGSRLTLERLGVWADLETTPIDSIHISQQGGFGRTLLEARDHGIESLGHVTSAGMLAAALRRGVERAGMTIIDHTRVGACVADGDLLSVDLHACDGSAAERTEVTRLLACAEGGLDTGDARVVQHDYHQTALIATVRVEGGHAGRAFERFTPDGPIALLPHGDAYALVHVTSSDRAEALVLLDDADYLQTLQAHLGTRVRLTGVTGRLRYPLMLRYRRDPVDTRARTVWLGNAAQTLHPVAGQGFNLALRDVHALAATLLDHPGDPGSASTLSAYARARRTDRAATIGFTDTLIKAFSNDVAPLRHVRGAGLFALDLLPPLSGFIARRMMFGARAWP